MSNDFSELASVHGGLGFQCLGCLVITLGIKFQIKTLRNEFTAFSLLAFSEFMDIHLIRTDLILQVF